MLSKEILSYIADVNPAEIKAQIEAGNLENFCNDIMRCCSKALGVKGNPYEVIAREDGGKVTTGEAAVIAKEYMEISEMNKVGKRIYPWYYSVLNASELLEMTKILDAVGEPYGSASINKSAYSYYYLSSYLRIVNYKEKGDHPYGVLNSAKHAEFKPGCYIVFDNGNIGRLMFVDQCDWKLVQDEWDEFMDKLISYNPVDYDRFNTHMVFSIEDGKCLAHDYKKIVAEISDKMDKKIKKKRLEEKKAELEKMQKELEEDEDDE